MKWIPFLVVLAACAPSAPAKTEVTHACSRSFAAVLDAWNGAAETAGTNRAPDECTFLDTQYDVSQADGITCDAEPHGDNEHVVGCTFPETHEIVIWNGLDDAAAVDTSVHEWIHALANCVLGDPDAEHLRAGLWAQFGANSVEIQASAAAQIGECL